MFWLFAVNPILIAAAVIPAVVLLVKVYKADRLEKESPRLLLSLVLSGVFATALAKVTERVGDWALSAAFGNRPDLYRFWLFFGVVAFSEEGFKYLLLKRKTWRNPEFDCQFDAVVYSAFVALGFALWENIGYVFMYGLRTALVRAVTAVPGHCCFGVFMGTWYGLAKRLENGGSAGASRLCRVAAVVCPALLHGAYDYIASAEAVTGAWPFVGFVAAMFLLAFLLVRWLSRQDRYI